MKGASTIQPFGLRLPQELKEWVEQESARERRSMNGQIIAELEARRITKEREALSAGERTQKTPVFAAPGPEAKSP